MPTTLPQSPAPPLVFGCLFSGIGCADVGFGRLGWRAAFHAEIDPFACRVLEEHYPDVPNLGDVVALPDDPEFLRLAAGIDVLMFSPPCQAFSVAGLRGGLADDRGNLTLESLRAVRAAQPLWTVTENVPGWLSDGGNAFGCFLAGLLDLVARLLDFHELGNTGLLTHPPEDPAEAEVARAPANLNEGRCLLGGRECCINAADLERLRAGAGADGDDGRVDLTAEGLSAADARRPRAAEALRAGAGNGVATAAPPKRADAATALHGEACRHCGHAPFVQSGACKTCRACGDTSGCG